MDEFKFSGVLWRMLFSLVLVLLTFNPTGRSYYHWLVDSLPSIQPLEAVAGLLLLGMWVSVMGWVVLTILGLVLGFGMSWAHVRRRVSGQASVDRVD